MNESFVIQQRNMSSTPNPGAHSAGAVIDHMDTRKVKAMQKIPIIALLYALRRVFIDAYEGADWIECMMFRNISS
jgi:hypothetical protein